jgi:hypothetical protein
MHQEGGGLVGWAKYGPFGNILEINGDEITIGYDGQPVGNALGLKSARST